MPMKLVVPGAEQYDPVENLFYTTKDTTLLLEHSLLSISKWESKWKKPFMNNKGLTKEQLDDYIKCMTITQNVDPLVYSALTKSNYEEVAKYMEDPMTATTINEKNIPKGGPSGRGKIVTSELIYYWMTALNIPFECERWHLNRLMTLIRVASIEQQPPKQMSKRDIMSQNKSLNAARRARLKSKG